MRYLPVIAALLSTFTPIAVDAQGVVIGLAGNNRMARASTFLEWNRLTVGGVPKAIAVDPGSATGTRVGRVYELMNGNPALPGSQEIEVRYLNDGSFDRSIDLDAEFNPTSLTLDTMALSADTTTLYIGAYRASTREGMVIAISLNSADQYYLINPTFRWRPLDLAVHNLTGDLHFIGEAETASQTAGVRRKSTGVVEYAAPTCNNTPVEQVVRDTSWFVACNDLPWRIRRIDLATLAPAAGFLPLASYPIAVDFDPAQNTLYAISYSDSTGDKSLNVFNLTPPGSSRYLQLPYNPMALAVDRGTPYIAYSGRTGGADRVDAVNLSSASYAYHWTFSELFTWPELLTAIPAQFSLDQEFKDGFESPVP